MSTHVRLSVLQTVADIFIFSFRKFPSLFVLTLVAAVIAEPLTFLSLQFTGTFAEVASLAQSSVVTDRIIESLPKTVLGFLIVLMGALLFLALIAVAMLLPGSSGAIGLDFKLGVLRSQREPPFPSGPLWAIAFIGFFGGA